MPSVSPTRHLYHSLPGHTFPLHLNASNPIEHDFVEDIKPEALIQRRSISRSLYPYR